MTLRRILDREQFLFLLDLEVKRARRYQNFFSILILKMAQLPRHENEERSQTGQRSLARLFQDGLRESDILGSLAENRLVILLPYADQNAGGSARIRVEGDLQYFDFKHEGVEVTIDQVSFPKDGANLADLEKKVLGTESPQ